MVLDPSQGQARHIRLRAGITFGENSNRIVNIFPREGPKTGLITVVVGEQWSMDEYIRNSSCVLPPVFLSPSSFSKNTNKQTPIKQKKHTITIFIS
jgi:hypothetical protein